MSVMHKPQLTGEGTGLGIRPTTGSMPQSAH
jgi:hypothetical protein